MLNSCKLMWFILKLSSMECLIVLSENRLNFVTYFFLIPEEEGVGGHQVW
jgi:hypothetical protein